MRRCWLLLLLAAQPQHGADPTGCPASGAPYRIIDSATVPNCYDCSTCSSCPSCNQSSPFPAGLGHAARSRYGITPRDGFEFIGWKCSVGGCNHSSTAATQAGTYFFPQILGDGNYSGDPKDLRNGGVPQAANLSLQLEHMRAGIDLWLPDVDFAGYSGIDFETWSPIWDDNTCASHPPSAPKCSPSLVATSEKSCAVSCDVLRPVRLHEPALPEPEHRARPCRPPSLAHGPAGRPGQGRVGGRRHPLDGGCAPDVEGAPAAGALRVRPLLPSQPTRV